MLHVGKIYTFLFFFRSQNLKKISYYKRLKFGHQNCTAILNNDKILKKSGKEGQRRKQ
jgi:hypothetical protein